MFDTSSQLNIKQGIITLLSLCLVIIISLYLYSTYFSSSKLPADPAQPAQTNSTIVEQPASTTPTTPENTSLPTKDLPVPAHQIKKLLSESDIALPQALQQKISETNQQLESIQAQLPTNPEVAPEPASVTLSEKDQQLQKRADTIRQHLQQNNH